MFSKLEKDQKTLNIIYKYLGFFADGKTRKDLFIFKQHLQNDEVLNHLRNNGLDENDLVERNNWCIKNGEAYNEYLNACKEIAILIRWELIKGITKLENINDSYIFDVIYLYDKELLYDVEISFGKYNGNKQDLLK